jgi:hypothetical protein
MRKRLAAATLAAAFAVPLVGTAPAQAVNNYFNGVIGSGGNRYANSPHNTSGTEADSTGPNACTGVVNVYVVCSGSAYDVGVFNYPATGVARGHNHDGSSHYYHLYWFA